MRSRYDLAQDSPVLSEKGTFYKDIFTIPIQKFNHDNPSLEISITKDIIKRPDYFSSSIYGEVDDELEDIVFWLNDIGLIYDKTPGDLLDAPSMTDIENFYYKYRV